MTECEDCGRDLRWQYGLCWGNPVMPDLQMREEWVRAGLRPMRIDYRDLVKA